MLCRHLICQHRYACLSVLIKVIVGQTMLRLVIFFLYGPISVLIFYELSRVLLFVALHDAATDYLTIIQEQDYMQEIHF
jgi:uncharacterized membrane protein